jgi:hypothetical protein
MFAAALNLKVTERGVVGQRSRPLGHTPSSSSHSFTNTVPVRSPRRANAQFGRFSPGSVSFKLPSNIDQNASGSGMNQAAFHRLMRIII